MILQVRIWKFWSARIKDQGPTRMGPTLVSVHKERLVGVGADSYRLTLTFPLGPPLLFSPKNFSSVPGRKRERQKFLPY